MFYPCTLALIILAIGALLLVFVLILEVIAHQRTRSELDRLQQS